MNKTLITSILSAFILISVLFYTACKTEPEPTTGDISGTILEEGTNTAISDATVILSPGGTTKTTGSDGKYTFLDLEPIEYTITAQKTGYLSNPKSVTVSIDETKTLDIPLALEETFKPTITASPITVFSQTTAEASGNITDLGSSNVTAHGHVWSTSPSPELGVSNAFSEDYGSKTEIGTFTSNLTELTPETEYFVRAYATNTQGTSYSAEKSFTTNNSAVLITQITISGPDITQNNGSSQMVATILPSNATNKAITWSLRDNTPGATITDDGLITANGESNGTVIVKAEAQDGSGESYELLLTISNQSNAIDVTGIEVSGSDIVIDGGTSQMSVLVTPTNATNKAVSWTLENNTIGANISASGVLTADGEHDGTVTVKATAQDGSGTTGTKVVNIGGQKVEVEQITVYGSNITTDGGTSDMTVVVLPSNATNKNVTWSLENNVALATISPTSGTVEANGVNNGPVTVRAIAQDGSGETDAITIQISGQVVPVSSIAISGNNITTDGGTSQMSAAVSPSNATQTGVSWSVGTNTLGVTITANGLLQSNGETGGNGEVTVTASANDNSGVTKEKTITISNQYTPPGSVQDSEGNQYNYITIGNQVWMTENLKSTKYSDGTNLEDGTGIGDITGNFSAKYYFAYDDDENNVTTYGRLYTWGAVMNRVSGSNTNPSNVQGICPTGWHVPSDEEWKELEMYIGMTQSQANIIDGWRGTDEGCKLAGTASLWTDGILDADPAFQSTGFNGIPAGSFSYTGGFGNLYNYAIWWSTTEFDSATVRVRDLGYGVRGVGKFTEEKSYGFSVRCIRD